MAPSATDPIATAFDRQSPIPPPQLYPVREAHYEKFIEPQGSSDYSRAKQRDGAAIVIDNGTSLALLQNMP
jgi:actin-related protein 5